VVPPDASGGIDDEHAALLVGVALDAFLAEAAQQGAEGAEGQGEVDEAAASEVGGAVGGERGVGVDGAGVACGLAEAGDEVGGAVADDVGRGAGSADRVLVVP
jgi:hypothetical protein